MGIAVRNIAPASDLAHILSRFFMAAVDQAGDAMAEEILLNEEATILIPLGGDWAWLSDHGEWQTLDQPTLFGPRERAMRLSARGQASIVGFAIRPAGWLAFDKRPASAVVDSAEILSDAWQAALSSLKPIGSDQIIATLEDIVRTRLASRGRSADAKAAQFEAMVKAESNITVTEAAAYLAMTSWQFDRFVRRHFGHRPKLVLRRSRFLDMAGVMHGVASADTDALAPVRFYDASHLNREFRTFVDMTPGMFARARTPLFNAELEARAGASAR